MKTFLEYVNEADVAGRTYNDDGRTYDDESGRTYDTANFSGPAMADPASFLGVLKKSLDQIAKTSDLNVEVSAFRRSIYMTVNYEQHPGDFSETGPGVSAVIEMVPGNKVRAHIGFYPNWMKASEGTRFTKTNTKNYSMNMENASRIAVEVMRTAATMLTSNTPDFDPSNYTKADHAAAWDKIRSRERY